MNLGEPRELSRFLRQMNRALGSLFFKVHTVETNQSVFAASNFLCARYSYKR